MPLFDHRISPTSGYGRPIGMNTPETKEEMLAIAHQQLEHMRNQHAERHEDENDLNPDQSKVLLQFWRDMEQRNATHSSLRAYCKIRADEYKGKLQAHREHRKKGLGRMSAPKGACPVSSTTRDSRIAPDVPSDMCVRFLKLMHVL